MNKKGLLTRTGIGATGAILLMSGAGMAVAAELSDENIDITVEIPALEPVGALTMTVAANATTLAEVDSGDETIRQFDGTLPTVTVTDDRDEVPADVFWYVMGQSSAFTADELPDIAPENLGWAPNLITDDGGIIEGQEVLTALDGEPGLEGEELLAMAWDSAEVRPTGSWDADAELFLKTPADVAPGSYSATLTLTLWEDAQ